MKMRPVEGGIEIPSAGLQMLKPGSYHIMLIGLNRDLKSGDTFEVTLTFANAGDITVTIPVR
jgi:copper(I)-binding protein